jgi:hypothetical protein
MGLEVFDDGERADCSCTRPRQNRFDLLDVECEFVASERAVMKADHPLTAPLRQAVPMATGERLAKK